MRDFSRRSTESELMDEDGISLAEFRHCLKSLEIINVLTLAYRPTLRWLRREVAKAGPSPVHVLDAGSGGGDMLRRIGRIKGHLNLTGVDLNPMSAQVAAESPSPGVNYETADIFKFEPKLPPDYIVCSLFTHHLDDERLVEFLRWLDRRAGRGWFINDLHRHWLPYYFIKWTTALFSRNRLIRNDAAVSVARSFTIADWRQLLARAGINGARVQWVFPFRLCVSYART
ncbi:MAG TPA: methyltransferase domain-containing protein [Patescibacteria group bacterium]|nr:methyltransferase domain-containing protein [Patescibacteria group bacterium]